MKDIALYIHIPFCNSKCYYCDFYSCVSKQNKENYITALENEFEKWKSFLKNRSVKTIYIGGGTPSVMPPTFFYELARILKQFCNLNDLLEFTVEVNPNSFNEELAICLKEIGVNRISMGFQSGNDKLLSLIGRNQNFSQFTSSYNIAKKYFNNISVDLMVGLPGQKLVDVKNSVKKLLKFKPQHISCYYLMLEKETILAKNEDLIKLIPKENEQVKMFSYISKSLKKHKFEQYEISNFAKLTKNADEFISKHNSSYWLNCEYIGLGPGASSFIDSKRLSNEKNLEKYLLGKYEVITDAITPEKARMERVMLGLRTKWGCAKGDCNRENAEMLIKNGFIKEKNRRIYLTKKGFNLLNLIIEKLT